MKKISALICTYNKEAVLPNTLWSLSRQEMPGYEFEAFFFDDGSKIDPYYTIKHFFPRSKYYRSAVNIGGRHAQIEAFRRLQPDGDIILTISSDVILIDTSCVAEMANHTIKNRIIICAVANAIVPPDSWHHTALFLDEINKKWNTIYTDKNIYQGTERPDGQIYLFCATMTGDDFLYLMQEDLACDVEVFHRLCELKVEIGFSRHIRAVHQQHVYNQHRCRKIDICQMSEYCKERDIKNFES